MTAVEGNAGSTAFVFTVSRTDTSAAASIDWSTAVGTATSPADFTAVAATPLAFAAGQGTRQVTVNVVGETLFEGNETFFVNLSNPSAGWSIGDGQGLGTIQNDDAQPAIAIADRSALEGDAGTTAFLFTLTLSNPSSQTVTVLAQTADGTATAPGDYTAVGPAHRHLRPGDDFAAFHRRGRGRYHGRVGRSLRRQPRGSLGRDPSRRPGGGNHPERRRGLRLLARRRVGARG